MDATFSRCRLFRKRALWLPTWRLCVPAFVLLLVLAVFAARHLHGFLAVTEPVDAAEVLVVEGWMADGALEQVMALYSANPRYKVVCTTGTVIERGFYLSDIKDYATLCARSLEKMGVPKEKLIVCVTPPVKRNRTFESAVALRARLAEDGIACTGLDVASVGAHARRTRLNYRHAFGEEMPVGVLAIDWLDYDPKRWWTSSAGLKQVMMETMALGFEWMEGPSRN